MMLSDRSFMRWPKGGVLFGVAFAVVVKDVLPRFLLDVFGVAFDHAAGPRRVEHLLDRVDLVSQFGEAFRILL